MRKSQFPWSFHLILLTKHRWFPLRSVSHGGFSKEISPTTKTSLPPLGTRCHAGWEPTSVVGPCCFWAHLCKSLFVVSAELLRQPRSIIKTFSFVDGLLPCLMKQPFGDKNSHNEKWCVNNWKLNECVSINVLHSPCALLKKWCLYSEAAAGFQYGKERKDPREMDPAAPTGLLAQWGPPVLGSLTLLLGKKCSS